MFKKSQLKTIADCQQALRSLIDVEYFAYDVKKISFYFGTVKIVLDNADYKPLVDKGPKLAELQQACLNFSATYNYEVGCRTNNEGLIQSTLAIYQWDDTTEKMVLLPVDEYFQSFECPPLPDDDTITTYIDRPITAFSPESVVEVKTEKEVKTKKVESIEPEIVEDNRPIKLPSDISVYICLTNKEGLTVKKRIPITLEGIRSHLVAWFHATDQMYAGQLLRFKEALIDCKHNALVLYLYRPYTWIVMDVAGVKQLRRKEIVSEGSPELRPQTKGSIQKARIDAIPEIGSMYQISPIKLEENGCTYLAQTYIELVEGEYLTRCRKVALFDKGILRYHADMKKFQTEIDKHDIYPLVSADGIKIFPQMSIFQIELQTLVEDELHPGLYIQSKKPHYEPIIGGRLIPTSSAKPDDMHKFVKIGNDYKIVSAYVNSPINFLGFKHPNIQAKPAKKAEITQRQNIKPTKLHNEKSVTGQIEFTDVISTVPMLLRLTPAETGYKLVGLPVKLPDDYCYDLARYITSNLGASAIGYLNNEIQRIKSLSTAIVGRLDRQDLLDALLALKDGVNKGQKLDPRGVLESKNKIRAYLNQQQFYASSTDQYYAFYNLASVKIIQETETTKYSYRLTNFADPMALIRANLSSVQTWQQRLNYNLKNYFGIKKPDFDEVKTYLRDNFKFKNCQLKTYWDTGICFEIWHQDKMVSKQHITIIDPAHSKKEYNLQSVNIARNVQFSDTRVFEKVLKCNNVLDSDLVQFAKNQLSKVVDKFITSNERKLVGANKVAQTSKVRDVVGFGKTSHGFSNIKSTFLKFIRPFCDGAVNKGKLINLRTGKILDQHSANDYFEIMVNAWKEWDRDKDQVMHIKDIVIKKPNPGKMMLEVHNIVSDNPALDEIVWPEVLETWWQLTKLPIGFKTSEGVILTAWSLFENRADIWQYRLNVQLIDILRQQKSSRGEVDTIESFLQMSETKLKTILNTVYPSWGKEVSQDVLKHLDALEEALALAREASKL